MTMTAKARLLQERSELMWALRAQLRAFGSLEMSPPCVVACPGMEPHLDAFEVVSKHSALSLSVEEREVASRRRWLHTSPEHALKRLLGEGLSKVYALTPCFRDEPPSRTHNPEFTMLEWYERGLSLEGLMRQCEVLISTLAERAWRLIEERPEGLTQQDQARLHSLKKGDFERLSVREAFVRYAGVDLERAREAGALKRAALDAGLSPRALEGDLSWDEVYFQLFLDLVEPHLGRGRPTLLYDFPASQSALARLKPGAPQWALRFELFIEGLELANAFDELSDPREQRARFEAERAEREVMGVAQYPIDEELLKALPRMGDCVGIAMGVERLLMCLLGVDEISELISQPWAHP